MDPGVVYIVVLCGVLLAWVVMMVICSCGCCDRCSRAECRCCWCSERAVRVRHRRPLLDPTDTLYNADPVFAVEV